MIEWTEEQKEAIKLLRDFLDNKSDDAYDYPFVINGSAGTGKSFLLSEYLKKTNLKYLVLCFTGKASNVLSRRGIPSETIHHCLYLPTDLSTWKKFTQKINYGLVDCKGIVEQNPDWNEKDPNTEYQLTYTGDRDIVYYLRKNKNGEEIEEIVNNESDVPDDYEPLFRHEENVVQSIKGRKEIFKEWDTDNKYDMKEFLEYQNIIGFEDLRDESEGGSWLFKLRADRLYKIDTLVVDEYGMVPYDMMEQLLKTCKEMKVKLILSGDPAQLKPISKENKPMEFEPTVTLTQIMRQSSDNPILQFATLIRLYGVKVAIKQMFEHQSDKFIILDENDVTDELLQQYKSMNSQILCGTNRTRKWLNKRVKGNEKLEIGDKIIITDINNWDYNIDKSQNLTNGTQGIVTSLELPDEHFYPEWRPRLDDVGEYDFENPIEVSKPSKYDMSHDYRLCNYICKVDFESQQGDHEYDNRKMINLPIAISRAIDDERFEDWKYLPKTNTYGLNSKGSPKRISSKDKITYQYDYIVEHFEGQNREYNQEPKHYDDKLIKKYYKKCYDDYYSCPDYRKKKKVERLDNDEEHIIYNCDRTENHYLRSSIADFSYAITVHKSQGSEYDNGLIYFEPFGTDSDIQHWLYTAVTRFKDTLILTLTKNAQEYLGLKLE